MEQRLSIVTLGVKNLKKSRKFYETLGWKAAKSGDENITFFQVGGMAVALYPRDHLAKDCLQKPKGSGFRGITLAHNVRDKKTVAKVLQEAKAAGGKIIKPAQDVFWGGHSGYFSDPDGHLWEVAWNPFSKIDKQGRFILSS